MHLHIHRITTRSLALPETYVPAADANQPPPLQQRNLFATDTVLRDAVQRDAADRAVPQLLELGARCAEHEVMAWGDQANRHVPLLHAHDRYGKRRDVVEFHPAYHALMRMGRAAGLHSGPSEQPHAGAHLARAAAYVLCGQVNNGNVR